MQKSKILMGLGILVAVVGTGLGIGWLATRGGPPPVPPEPIQPASVEPAHTIPAVAKHTARPVTPTVRPQKMAAAVPTAIQTAPAAVAPVPNLLTNWEDKVDEILSADSDDTNKVQQLFAMFPSLPADGQEEVAQHLSNLVEDEDYTALGKLLSDAKLPEDVLDVLLSDLLNRPNATKLPMLVDVALNPAHPKAEEARDLLELYLDEDYSKQPDLLRQKLLEYLKNNPD